MSIWNKVLVGFVFVVALVFFYMAMRTLKTHQYWRELANRFEERTEQVEKENDQLKNADGEGEDGEMGTKRLKLELHKLMIGRGRVWYNCTPGQADAATGEVAVTTDLPDPHRITVKAVLYVFEESEIDQGNPGQSGCYLGEFKVTEVGDDVVLVPAVKMDDGELQRLAASRGPWTLYEEMPDDNHEVFAELDEAELRRLFPEKSLPEYVNDGQLITSDDAEDMGLPGKLVEVDENGDVVYVDESGRVVRAASLDENGEITFEDESGKEVAVTEIMEKEIAGGKGKYVRMLRDYEVLLKDIHSERALTADRTEIAQRDLELTITAKDDADVQRRFRQQEKTNLISELAEAIRQRHACTDHQALLTARLKASRLELVQMIARNQATAGQIARIQADAVERIDARTRRMARNGAPGN